MKVPEEWKSIPGYEGIYEVSNHGRVRGLDRKDSVGRIRRGKILSPSANKGYRFVILCNGSERLMRIHQLVAAAFLGEKPEGYEINHIDGDKNNNSPSNLEYVTHLENMQHAVESGIMGRRVWRKRRAKKQTPSS